MRRRLACFWFACGAMASAAFAQGGARPQASPPGTAAAPTKAAIIAAARDVMGRARFATLATVDATGQPQSRVVDPLAPDKDFVVWIGTNPLSRKVGEIRGNNRVSLLYFDVAGLEYAALTGTATIVSGAADKAKPWKPEWAQFYPKGVADSGFVLIRVKPAYVEVVSPRHKLMNDPKTWRPIGTALP